VSLIFGAVGGFAAGYLTRSAPAAQAREFYVFTSVLPFNDTIVGLPHDVFVPDRIVVNRGDTVTIRFYNTEDEPERHTFTMDAPYSLNVDLNWNENHTFPAFTAGTSGVFTYRCNFHLPSMIGEFVVIG